MKFARVHLLRPASFDATSVVMIAVAMSQMAAIRSLGNIMDLKSLIFGTDPLALIALGGFVTVLVVSLGLLFFMLKKLPGRR